MVVEDEEPTVAAAEAVEPTVAVEAGELTTVAVAEAEELTEAEGINAATRAEGINAATLAGRASLSAIIPTMLAIIPTIPATVLIMGAVSIGSAVVPPTGVMGIPIIMAV